jgi:predicted RecA/RadA family phage recombinase
MTEVALIGTEEAVDLVEGGAGEAVDLVEEGIEDTKIPIGLT